MVVTLAAMGAFYATRSKAWGAIAHFGAVINLFNLIPVWQLDGSRGLRSASRQQRLVIVALAAGLGMITSQPMVFLIAAAGAFRLFTKDAPAEGDSTGLMQFAGILVGLSAIAVLAQRVGQ